MAGFFGLFNYEKEGPGIEKNAPKKKTFIVFFETFFRNFWKFIPINFVYSLISIPLITTGISAVGLTNVTRNTARDKHSFGLSDFFETIKKNLFQAIAAGIINVVAIAVLAFALFFYYSSEGTVSIIGLGISFAILYIFTVMGYYMWTLMITFNYTLKQIYTNSFKFVFLNMKNNILCTLCLILVYGIYIAIFLLFPYYIVIVLEILIGMITLPGFTFLMIQYFTFPSIKKFIIDPYYAEHPDEDLDKRRNLGIEIEGENDDSQEDVETDETDTI